MKIIYPRIGQKIKTPIIGSGKIKRRIEIKTKKKKRFNLESFMKRKSGSIPIKQKETKVPIHFPSSYAKVCFNYWNSLGHPFTRHLLKKTKQTTRGLFLLNKAIKKDGKQMVITSMETAKESFNSRWFINYLFIGSRKLTLSSFFRYSDSDYKRHKKILKNLPRSWYGECKKGEKYLKKNYSMIRKDNFKDITDQLVDIWQRYVGEEIEISERNTLTMCSENLVKFSKANEMGQDYLISNINNILNEWRTFRPDRVGYLVSKIFWNRHLPKELERYDPVHNKKDWVRVL